MRIYNGPFLCIALLIVSTLIPLGGFSQATYTWSGVDSTWNEATNWNPNGVPGAADDVIITSGKVKITSDVQVNNVTFTAGAITGSAILTVTGQMNWMGGEMSGNGITQINSGAALAIGGNTQKDLRQRTLRNLGTATWSGDAELKLRNHAHIQNEAGALFDIQNNKRMDYVLADSGGSFTNAGTLAKSAGGGETQIDPVFINTATGVVNANSGIFRFERGDTTASSSGTFNIGSGNFLVLAERKFIFDNVIFNGSGTVQILDVDVNVSPSTGVVIDVIGAGITVNSGIQMEMDESKAMFKGSGPVTIDGTFTLKRGTISGPGLFTVNGAFDLGGDNSKTIDGRTITIEGSLLRSSSGLIYLTNNAVISIESGASFDIQSDGGIDFVLPGGGSISNAGTVSKSSGSGVSNFDVPFNNTGALNVNSGTVQLSRGGSHTGSALSVGAGATLNFNGGVHTLDGVILGGSGAVQISSDSVKVTGAGVAINASTTLALAGGTLAGEGNVTVNGTLNWSGGSITGSGALTINSSLNISGGSNKTLKGRTLTNAATTTWSGAGNFSVENNGVFLNQAGALLHIQSDAVLKFIAPLGGTLNNAGTLAKSGGAGASAIEINFINTGTVNVNSGKIEQDYSSSHSGAILNIASGSIFELKNNLHTMGNITVNGGGALQFSDASVSLANGGLTINSPSILAMSGSSNVLGGNTPVTVNGTFNWSGGTINGISEFSIYGYLNTSGSSAKTIDGCTFFNYGTAAITGSGSIRLRNNAALWNQAGATMAIQSDAGIARPDATNPTMTNAGTLSKSGGSGISTISVALSNSGPVNVNSGTLRISNGSSISNTMVNFSGGGILKFEQLAHTLDNVTFSGTGMAQIDRANMTINGNGVTVNSPAILEMDGSGSNILGSGPITVNGTFVWNRGVISGSAAFLLNGSCTIGSTNSKTLNGRILTNSGALNVSGTGTINLQNNAKFLNQGSGIISLQTDGSIAFSNPNGGTVENAGLVAKQSGAGSTTFNVDFKNTGILDAETGTLAFTRALLNDASGAIRGSGTLNISAATSFINYGAFNPGTSPGILVVNGNYSQNSIASLNIEVGGAVVGSQYDRLVVIGNAQLDGALNVSLINGFAPQVGDQFEVLFFTARSGDFSSFNYPDIGIGKDFEITYTPNSLLLSVIATETQANLKIWLEGPYQVAGYMETALNDSNWLPLNQPFGGAPWNYSGAESATEIPGDIVDWVLVELRSDTTAASKVAARAGWVNSEGLVMDLDGVTPLTFPVASGNYYAVVRHRNHLGVMSASALPLGTSSELYDFTVSQSQAYGSNSLKQLETGVYGMIAGDGNADSNVDANDRDFVWRPQNGTAWDYQKSGDFDLSGGIDASDLNNCWRGNNGSKSRVPSEPPPGKSAGNRISARTNKKKFKN